MPEESKIPDFKGVRYINEEGTTKNRKVCWECGGMFYVFVKHDFGIKTKYCSFECKIQGLRRGNLGRISPQRGKKNKNTPRVGRALCLNVLCNKIFKRKPKYKTKTVKNYKRFFDKRKVFCCKKCEKVYKSYDYREIVEGKIMEFEILKKDPKNDLPELQRLIIIYKASLKKYDIEFTEKEIKRFKKRKENQVIRLREKVERERKQELIESIIKEEITIEEIKDLGVRVKEDDVQQVIEKKELTEQEKRNQLLQQSRNIWLINK